jgi:hypothetical protein
MLNIKLNAVCFPKLKLYNFTISIIADKFVNTYVDDTRLRNLFFLSSKRL